MKITRKETIVEIYFIIFNPKNVCVFFLQNLKKLNI